MEAALSLETLGELDEGRARAVIDHEIAKAVSDLEDRGDDGQPRKVSIELVIVKLEGIAAASVKAQAKLPPLHTGATAAKFRHEKGQPQLQFQTMCAEDPDQATFPELDH